MNMFTKSKWTALSAVASVLCVGIAHADTTLKMDLNTLQVTADPISALPFDEDFTGTITLADHSLSNIAGMRINGVDQGYGSTFGSLASFSGTIEFVGGVLTNGIFVVTDSYEGDTFTGNFTAGATIISTGSTYSVFGLTHNGAFDTKNDSSFGDVDVSPFINRTLSGEFSNLDLGPFNATTGIDTLSDLELTVIAPTPGAALASIPMLGFLITRRRRGSKS